MLTTPAWADKVNRAEAATLGDCSSVALLSGGQQLTTGLPLLSGICCWQGCIIRKLCHQSSSWGED